MLKPTFRKIVLQALVEKHFPAPDRDRIHRLLGIGKPKSLLDELGIGKKEAEEQMRNGAGTSDGRRRRRQAAQKKKTKGGFIYDVRRREGYS